MNFKTFAFLFLIFAIISAKSGLRASSETNYNGCSGSDCIIYDLSTQNSCTLKSSGSTRNIAWTTGLSRNVDFRILGGRVIAYQLQWFSGAWTSWYVPGINDIDVKKNYNNTLRRMWSYFYDHTFQYLICL